MFLDLFKIHINRGKLAEWVRVLADKLDDLGDLIPGTYMVEGENELLAICPLTFTYAPHICVEHTLNKNVVYKEKR